MSSFLLLIALPLSAAAAYIPWRQSRTLHSTMIAASVVNALLAVSLAWRPLLRETPFVTDWWSIDSFSGVLLLLIALLTLAAIVVSTDYLRREMEEGHLTNISNVRFYYGSVHLFSLGMMITVVANNIMLMWLALESTTLATTLLVAFYAKEGAIEAAWKYIVICSTGIALGLIGMLIAMYAAAISGSLSGQSLFLLSSLNAHAAAFPPTLLRAAFIFIFIGIGTKVGLVPMHTWLPDAHSKTPSPVSALLSGILLNVAFYVILRFTFITDVALGSSAFTAGFFLVFGLLSIALPAFIILTQGNYKRLLAYSSIEHMGILSFAIGLGPLGGIAAVMHMIGHAFAKSLLFFGAGTILLHWKTTKIGSVRGVLQIAPFTGILFLLGLLAILAVPPSPLFVSELFIVAVGMVRHPALTLLFVLLLTIVFIGMMRAVFEMLFTENSLQKPSPRERWSRTHTVMLIELLCLAAASIFFMTADGHQWVASVASHFTPFPAP